MTCDFGIVIPHLDETRFLETCLRSILFQEGDATAHIHIQDGGSGAAASIVGKLQNQIDGERFKLTYTQEPDKNAADAINKGMVSVDARMVSWLGSDDLLLPGCFRAITTLREKFPSISWLTGHPQVVSEKGVLLPVWDIAGPQRFPTGYSRDALRRGLHASLENHGTIQQEGTFWSQDLWSSVGGLNTDFSLAFDFDLWCRLADLENLFELVTPLAAFRKRKGQASEDSQKYMEEVAAIRSMRSTLSDAPLPKRRLERLDVLVPGNPTGEWKKYQLQFVVDYKTAKKKLTPFQEPLFFAALLRGRASRVLAKNSALRRVARVLARRTRSRG